MHECEHLNAYSRINKYLYDKLAGTKQGFMSLMNTITEKNECRLFIQKNRAAKQSRKRSQSQQKMSFSSFLSFFLIAKKAIWQSCTFQKCLNINIKDKKLGGGVGAHSTMVGVLASHPTAPGSNLGRDIFSEIFSHYCLVCGQ